MQAATSSELLRRVVRDRDRSALALLWDRLHPKIRAEVAKLPSAGRPGSTLQPTAVAHSVYRLQKTRVGVLKDSDVRYCFGRWGIELEPFKAGEARCDEERAERIFSCIVRNEARTYLADKRRRQHSLQ